MFLKFNIYGIDLCYSPLIGGRRSATMSGLSQRSYVNLNGSLVSLYVLEMVNQYKRLNPSLLSRIIATKKFWLERLDGRSIHLLFRSKFQIIDLTPTFASEIRRDCTREKFPFGLSLGNEDVSDLFDDIEIFHFIA